MLLPKEIEIVTVRDITYEQAKKEIIEYDKNKLGIVYISELAEKLTIDFEIIEKVLFELVRCTSCYKLTDISKLNKNEWCADAEGIIFRCANCGNLMNGLMECKYVM